MSESNQAGNGNFFEASFGLDDALYRRAMSAALERGGDFCDLFFQQRSSTSISLEDGEVNRAHRVEDLGVGVRVVVGDSTGFAFSEELEERSLLEAARVASAIAHAGASAAPQAITPSALPQRYPVEVPWSEVGTARKLPLLQRVHQRAMAADPRMRKVRMGFADSETRILIVDSWGRKAFDLQPMTVLHVSCVAEKDGRREENYHGVGGRHGFEVYTPELLDQITDEAVQRTLLLFQAVRPSAGEMPVVLAAGSSGILLHEAIGHGMEADFNRKGISIFADRVGTSIAPEFVSIVDDGTQPGSRGSINVDDEGNAVGCTVLVDRGVLRSYMHDQISARHYQVEPTGNGRRESFRHAPLPRMRNTYMLPGPHHQDEIIASVKKGIYAVTFTNGQVQIGAGDFTFYIKTGYLIEDGKLTAPIKDVNIIGNGPRVLQEIAMVGGDLVIDKGGWSCGKDGQGVPVALGLPTVKVASITVGGLG